MPNSLSNRLREIVLKHDETNQSALKLFVRVSSHKDFLQFVKREVREERDVMAVVRFF